MYTDYQIEEMVNKINKDLCLDINLLPSYGKNYGKKSSYVKIENDGYSFITFGDYWIKEQSHVNIKTLNIDELLFEIFKNATHRMAFNFELKNRIENQDFRIIAFKKHIEILNSLPLDKKFVNKLREYYDYLLSLKAPPPIPDNWFGN